MRWLLLLAGLSLATPALAQMRNVGPGVADRVSGQTRGGLSDEVILGGELAATLQSDAIGRRATRTAYLDSYTRTQLATYLLLPEGFSVNLVARLEAAEREPTGRGQFFRDATAWVDEFFLGYTWRWLDLFGGKFHPRFGSAWDRGPGLYGTDFGERYEQTQKLGVSARIWWSDLTGLSRLLGTHNIQAEFFQADRSVLSNSLFARRFEATSSVTDPETGETTTRTRLRFRNSRRSGGADNTDFMGGAVISAAGFGIPMPRGQAGYTLSYTDRRAGWDARDAGQAGRERGFSAGAFWTSPLPFRMVAAPFAEYARLQGADGFRERSRDYTTLGFDLRRTPWTFSYAYMNSRSSDNATGTRGWAQQHAASVTYDLIFVVPLPILRTASVTAGWRNLREDGRSANDVGALVGWRLPF
jgi:hypothetical protein